MSFVVFFISLLFQLLLFSQDAQLVPTFSSQPSSSTVEEGKNLVLQWSYNLDGQSILAAQFTNTTDGTSGAPTVAGKEAGKNVTVSSGYAQHFSAAVSDTQATLTISAAPRSINGNKYLFRIVTSPDLFNLASDEVEISVLYAPNITDISNQTFVEGESRTLNCATDGNPSPNITWTRLSNNSVVTFPLNIRRQDEGGYNCTADNGVGSPASGVAFITVHYKPENVQLVTNATANKICQGDTLKFTCSADGKPVVHTYQLFENEVPRESGSSGMWIKTVSNNGDLPNQIYKCVANNTVGTANSQNVSIFVGVPSSIQMIQNEVVTEGGDLNLSCIASGTPSPLDVSWINSSGHRHNGNVLELANINRSEAGEYRCEASNECGNSSETVNITVHYPPKITSPKADTKEAERDATIKCDAEGNPSPTFVWRNGTGGVVANEKTFVLTKNGNYTCIARNAVGYDTHSIEIEIPSDSYRGEVPVEELNGVAVVFIPEYNNLSSPPAIVFITKFGSEMDNLYANDSTYNRTEVTALSKGSVIVSFVLYFTTPVTASEGLAKLKAATGNGTLGPFTVGPLKIIQNVNPTSTPSVSSTGSTTAVPPVVTTAASQTDEPPWIIIGAVVGGVVVMVVIIAVVAWCVHKKRKCIKDTKIHNSESDVALEGQVNGGYADSGPPSANGANRTDASVLLHEQPTAAVPPTSALVDKKKKKEKKGDKKEDHNVAKQDVPDYAVVDKSQKKKKEVVEDAYDEVNMSKKSKKKAKPGEMLYADLGDFQPREMPAVSTSPAPLPPIKRPSAYEETQYADITQYFKGDATLPDNNNSQGTEMTDANVGGKEKPKNAANEGGNEEKPKETRM